MMSVASGEIVPVPILSMSLLDAFGWQNVAVLGTTRIGGTVQALHPPVRWFRFCRRRSGKCGIDKRAILF
jgi:hypothetical protein